MTIVIKIILTISIFAALYLGAGYIYAQNPAVQTFITSITSGINFIVGNMKAWNQIFPVFDLILAFTGVILIEGVIFTIKISKTFINFVGSIFKD